MAMSLSKHTKVLVAVAVAALSMPTLGAAQAREPLGWDVHTTEGTVLGERSPGGVDGSVSCSAGVSGVGSTASEGTLKCYAGIPTVECCTYQLRLGVTQGFTGTAQVRAQFSGGGSHTFRCTWTAPAGTLAPSCASFFVPPAPFVGETAYVTGQATGSSATGSWSFTAAFVNPA